MSLGLSPGSIRPNYYLPVAVRLPSSAVRLPQQASRWCCCAAAARPPVQMETVKLDDLRAVCHDALSAMGGYSREEIMTVTEVITLPLTHLETGVKCVLLQVMLYAQLRDNTQGIIKLATGALTKSPEAGPSSIQSETSVSALLDGNQGLGMVVLSEAMALAAEKAKQHGVGIVGTHNTCTTTGALGYIFHGNPPVLAILH